MSKYNDATVLIGSLLKILILYNIYVQTRPYIYYINFNYGVYISLVGTLCRSWLKHCATSAKATGSIPDGVIGIHWHNLSSHFVLGVDSASNRNEYQEYFLQG